MPSAAQGYEMYDARHNDRGKDHDTYFRRDEKSGQFVLKDGYEERYLGSGDYVPDGGALTTFSNDYDDLWDSYEPNRDKKVYGIFKEPSPSPSQQAPRAIEPPRDLPAPVDNRPVELSEELSSARKNVEDFNNNLSKTGDFLFSRSKDAAQSFKDNYATNLTKAYMTEDPTTLATNKAKMEQRSAQKANLLNSLDISSLSFADSTYR